MESPLKWILMKKPPTRIIRECFDSSRKTGASPQSPHRQRCSSPSPRKNKSNVVTAQIRPPLR